MRGDSELRCFETVKQNLSYENFFAMSPEDMNVVCRAFSEAIPNPELSMFPDFVFDDGFIEHFIVTSSRSNRKGSKMEQEKSEISREFKQLAEDAIKELPDNKVTISSIGTSPYYHETHSYDNFCNTFKTSFKKHLVSLSNYSGKTDHSIFMIEYNDSALRMNKIYSPELLEGVSYGDLLIKENPEYRLSRDVNLLHYIYEKKDAVDYVVFMTNSFHGILVDIIKTHNALELLKILRDGYYIYPIQISTSEYGVGFNIPELEKEKTNE